MNPSNFQRPQRIEDRTVSRRSEPSSRTTLIGEQPNPWDLLQPQDVMSRHRGAKLRRRCERLGGISLLSLGYLLSFKRWRLHFQPPDHLGLLSHLLDLYVSQLSFLIPICSFARLPTGPRKPSQSSVTLWEDREGFLGPVGNRAKERMGIRKLNCETYKSSRCESRPK